MGVFIQETGTCAATTPVKTFTWPATERRICLFDKSYRNVKHLPKSSSIWHASTDKLAGTTVEGTEGTMNAPWQIDYSAMTYSKFLFATGSMSHFVLANKSIKDVSGGPATFEILQSSLNELPHNVQINNRTGAANDPMITTSPIWNGHGVLYAEDSYATHYVG